MQNTLPMFLFTRLSGRFQKRKLSRLLRRSLKGLGIGALATLTDLIALSFLVEVVDIAPKVANAPALLLGAMVQFFGCRHALFDNAQHGSLRRQAGGFAITEAGTLALNAALFHVLVHQTSLPYLAARLLGAFAVFVCFSYPLWNRVFRTAELIHDPQ